MISVCESILRLEMEVIEEGAKKQIAAFLSGLDVILGTGGITGGAQKRNLKIYQRLQDKLNKKSFRKYSPSMITGFLLGVIPLVGSFMNLSNQKEIDKIRSEIKKKMDVNTVKRLDELTRKMKKGDIDNNEIKELADIESKLYSKFDEEEIRKLKHIAQGGD